ncbi:unnamed protein product [Nezara viridula]|uniref:Uncharacterized protein n=1 Tax=Nezara viridula TaxID=85310 RepID=A0A9P0H798_NEZVI|nr:unnamed protein product [Nezara viridula]
MNELPSMVIVFLKKSDIPDQQFFLLLGSLSDVEDFAVGLSVVKRAAKTQRELWTKLPPGYGQLSHHITRY